MKHILTILTLTAVSSQGATLRINLTNSSFAGTNPFLDSSSTPLDDGDLVMLGYFSDGSSNFDKFVSIDSASFQVGVVGGVDGAFTAAITLDDTGNFDGAPVAADYRFGMRIFDAPTEAAAANFNTVTDDTWVFSFWNGAGPPPPSSSMSVDPGFGAAEPIWQDSDNPLQTSIAIPEPSTSLTALLGLAFLTGKRRRK